MSLTRAEWELMWRSIKEIEGQTIAGLYPNRKSIILKEVIKIKELIESVIGQQE